MIDPKLLTEENGFVEGCVVEVVRMDGVTYYAPFLRIDACQVIISTPLGVTGASRFKDIKSIRPLTGPMAIWNFAPEWAEWCMEAKLNITWWDHEPQKQMAWHILSKRPFWAEVKR